MRLHIFKIIIPLLLPQLFNAQTLPFHLKAQKLIGTFSVYHPRPIATDAATASEISGLFVNELDNVGLILKASDVKILQENGSHLFEQINSRNDDYVKLAEHVYSSAVSSLDSIVGLIASKPLQFKGADSVYMMPVGTKTFYSPTAAYHAKRIERYLKSKAYDRALNTEGADKLTEAEFNSKAEGFVKQLADGLRKGIKERQIENYKTVESALLNAIAKRHDPHSDYFTQEQNQDFNRQLSAQVESFGLYFDEDEEGVITVSYIEPGGSAWLSNEVNEGDAFISAKIGNSLLTNEDNSAESLQDKLDKAGEKSVILTLKKQNGLTKKVKLLKQKVTSDENTVKGYVLSGPRGKIGYISLPSFYTDMDEHNAPGCANDVAKEILKLEQDSIRGLIIDLRNNGGGSMGEAMNLAGIFIDEGPLFIYKQTKRKPQLLKDINRGSIFKKPLVVMINETSASASELFSNIVKDYNLGLIVGHTSYGKGTSQIVLPLDTTLTNNKAKLSGSLDFMKMTEGKFYRLNCSTHQGQGVAPDVELPGTPGYSFYKESKEPFYLPADSVVKKVIYNPNPPLTVDRVRQLSAQRLASSKDFQRYRLCSDSVSRFLNSPQRVALKHSDYKKYYAAMNSMLNSFESAGETTTPSVKCMNNTFDKRLAEVNSMMKEFNEKVLHSVESDIFINETYNIISDLINP